MDTVQIVFKASKVTVTVTSWKVTDRVLEVNETKSEGQIRSK